MATTKIARVKSTPNASLNYARDDKEQKLFQTEKDDTTDALNYVMQDKRGLTYILSDDYLKKMSPFILKNGNDYRFETIVSSLNCSIENAHNEFKKTRELKNPKNGNKGVLQYVIHQNFGTDIDPLLANKIGVKFAKEYLSKYEVVIGTHINTGLVHNHIEFNATSFIDGKKFNNHRGVVKEIREVSDKICAEYGLDILEETRQPKFVNYLDSNGNVRSYEPTERKDELIEKRKKGEISKTADINSFVHTDTHENYTITKEVNTDTIRRDIDELIPKVKSFDELVSSLKEQGYVVRDKKKNGDYMEHISYKAPGQLKATREDKLGEEYTRDNLERRIINQPIKESHKKKIKKEIDNLIPISDNFNHLVRLLRERGYKVRDKKTDGSYMEHISYTAPGEIKPIRENRIGADYTRQSLERRIFDYKYEREYGGGGDNLFGEQSTPTNEKDKYKPNNDMTMDDVENIVHEFRNRKQQPQNKPIYAYIVQLIISDVTIRFSYLKRIAPDFIKNKEQQYHLRCIAEDCALLKYLDNAGTITADDLRTAFNGQFANTLNRLVQSEPDISDAAYNKPRRRDMER